MEWTLERRSNDIRIKSKMCKWCIVLFSGYEQMSLMNGSNISEWLLINKNEIYLLLVFKIYR